MIDVPSPGEPDHEPDVQQLRPDSIERSAPEAAPAHGLGPSSIRDEPLPNPMTESSQVAPADASPVISTPAPASSVTPASTAESSPSEPSGLPAQAPVVPAPSGEAVFTDPATAPSSTASAADEGVSSATPVETSDPVPSSAPAGVASDVVRPLPRVIAVANQKGGVGKTTTTVNLGASLAELDYRVLVVDLDPQGNATTGLGINPRTLEYTMYDILLNDVPLDECIEPTEVKGLFVAPASLDLAGAEVELVSTLSRESRLQRALADVIDDYDYVLIDCPPSLGLLTVNALAAATEVLVPIQCEYYALEGLGQLTRNVDLIQRNLNPDLEISAIVLVMYDARTRLGEQVATEVRAHFGSKVCRNVIPRNVRLSEAPSFGKPINTFDPSSRGAVAYRELAREVSGGS